MVQTIFWHNFNSSETYQDSTKMKSSLKLQNFYLNRNLRNQFYRKTNLLGWSVSQDRAVHGVRAVDAEAVVRDFEGSSEADGSAGQRIHFCSGTLLRCRVPQIDKIIMFQPIIK